MDLNSITLRGQGELMHLAPNGREGYEYTAEEVYEMVQQQQKKVGAALPGGGSNGSTIGKGKEKGEGKGEGKGEENDAGGNGLGLNERHVNDIETQSTGVQDGIIDDHTKWEEIEKNEEFEAIWVKRLDDITKRIERTSN